MNHLQVTSPGTLDAKGRVKLPSKLLKQLGEDHNTEFILKLERDEKIISVFPKAVWEERMAQMNAKMDFNLKKHRLLARKITMDTHEVKKDSSDRINIPNYMVEYTGMDSQLMIHAYFSTIEIWAKDQYEAYEEDDTFDVDEAAAEILGKK